MPLKFAIATERDAAAIAALRTVANHRLTERYGQGHWSGETTEKSVLRAVADARVVIAKAGRRIVGTLKLQTKKPWAIDAAYFTPVKRALYLTDMAVLPDVQRTGVGRALLAHAAHMARAFPAHSLRLDAYDAPAGAGGFYAACGWTEVGRRTYKGNPLIYYELLLEGTPPEAVRPAK